MAAKIDWRRNERASDDAESEIADYGKCQLRIERRAPWDASDTRLAWGIFGAPEGGDVFGMNARRHRLEGGSADDRKTARKNVRDAIKKVGWICGG
jgi:hypothetical protein